MYTLAIVNQKGGVGKTTTAVTLAHGLARAGRRVLLVDLDAQGNCADALGLVKGPGLYRLLVARDVEQAVMETGRERLWLLPSDKTTVEVKTILAGKPFREGILKRELAQLERGFDVAVLDVAPGVDLLQVAALVACTGFVIPVALDHLAVIGAGDALATVAALAEAGAGGARFLGLLPTMWERTTKESHEQLKVLTGLYARAVWPPIPLDVKAREAPAYGQSLWEYAPGCRAIMGVEIGGKLIGGYAATVARMVRTE